MQYLPFQEALSRLRNNNTKVQAFKQLQELTLENQEPQDLSEYLRLLKRCNQANLNVHEKQMHLLLIGFFCQIFKENLIDISDQKPDFVKTLLSLLELIFQYFGESNPNVQKAASEAIISLFENCLQSFEAQIQAQFIVTPLFEMLHNGEGVIHQETASVCISLLMRFAAKNSAYQKLRDILLPQIVQSFIASRASEFLAIIQAIEWVLKKQLCIDVILDKNTLEKILLVVSTKLDFFYSNQTSKSIQQLKCAYISMCDRLFQTLVDLQEIQQKNTATSESEKDLIDAQKNEKIQQLNVIYQIQTMLITKLLTVLQKYSSQHMLSNIKLNYYAKQLILKVQIFLQNNKAYLQTDSLKLKQIQQDEIQKINSVQTEQAGVKQQQDHYMVLQNLQDVRNNLKMRKISTRSPSQVRDSINNIKQQSFVNQNSNVNDDQFQFEDGNNYSNYNTLLNKQKYLKKGINLHSKIQQKIRLNSSGQWKLQHLSNHQQQQKQVLVINCLDFDNQLHQMQINRNKTVRDLMRLLNIRLNLNFNKQEETEAVADTSLEDKNQEFKFTLVLNNQILLPKQVLSFLNIAPEDILCMKRVFQAKQEDLHVQTQKVPENVTQSNAVTVTQKAQSNVPQFVQSYLDGLSRETKTISIQSETKQQNVIKTIQSPSSLKQVQVNPQQQKERVFVPPLYSHDKFQLPNSFNDELIKTTPHFSKQILQQQRNFIRPPQNSKQEYQRAAITINPVYTKEKAQFLNPNLQSSVIETYVKQNSIPTLVHAATVKDKNIAPDQLNPLEVKVLKIHEQRNNRNLQQEKQIQMKMDTLRKSAYQNQGIFDGDVSFQQQNGRGQGRAKLLIRQPQKASGYFQDASQIYKQYQREKETVSDGINKVKNYDLHINLAKLNGQKLSDIKDNSDFLEACATASVQDKKKLTKEEMQKTVFRLSQLMESQLVSFLENDKIKLLENVLTNFANPDDMVQQQPQQQQIQQAKEKIQQRDMHNINIVEDEDHQEKAAISSNNQTTATESNLDTLTSEQRKANYSKRVSFKQEFQ